MVRVLSWCVFCHSACSVIVRVVLNRVKGRWQEGTVATHMHPQAANLFNLWTQTLPDKWRSLWMESLPGTQGLDMVGGAHVQTVRAQGRINLPGPCPDFKCRFNGKKWQTQTWSGLLNVAFLPSLHELLNHAALKPLADNWCVDWTHLLLLVDEQVELVEVTVDKTLACKAADQLHAGQVHLHCSHTKAGQC